MITWGSLILSAVICLIDGQKARHLKTERKAEENTENNKHQNKKLNSFTSCGTNRKQN